MGLIINPYLVQPSVPAFTGLLDTYGGAAVAYSAARRLSSTYTGSLIRVRRSSDNAEQDIGYDVSNVLDEAVLTAFVGAGNGFVTTWYDQSGNGKNAAQSTASAQCPIVISGSVLKLTGTGSAHPYLQWDYNRYYTSPNINLSSGQKFTSIHCDYKTAGHRGFWMTPNTYQSPSTAIHYWENNAYLTAKLYATTNDLIWKSHPTVSYNIITGLSLDSTTSSSIRFNGSALSSPYSIIPGLPSNNILNTLGSRAGVSGSDYTVGKVQEFILYLSDKTSDISGIENNINTFYGVY